MRTSSLHSVFCLATIALALASCGAQDTAFNDKGVGTVAGKTSGIESEETGAINGKDLTTAVVDAVDKKTVNVSDKGANGGNDADDNGTKLPAATPSPSAPTTGEEVAITCLNGQKQQVLREVFFPDPRATCSWGQNDNGSGINDFIRGRIEQTVSLQMPQNAVICDLDFRFKQQTMVYDDEIFLMFNDAVLAGSMDYTDLFEKVDRLALYDWSRVKDARYGHNLHPVYCLGAAEGNGSCTIPPTQQVGTMNLSFSEQVTHKLSASAIQAGRYDLKWVTLGDNDDGDCRHSDFRFSVEVTYVAQ